MGIDQSVLTIGLYLLAAGICSFRSYRKSGSVIYTGIVFLLVTSVYLWISCSIFPIQLISDFYSANFTFTDQFSVMNEWTGWDYIFFYKQFFSSTMLIAFFLYLIKAQDGKEKQTWIVLPVLPVVHVVYNVSMNTLFREVIKMVNLIDLVLMVVGSVCGCFLAFALTKIFPGIRKLKKREVPEF